MKQLAAILFLLLLIFNLAGYRLVFYVMQQQADKQLQVSLDNKTYDDKDLITLRVPLSLPYTTDTREFERVDGEINVNGIVYKYVKRKVEHGELVLQCIPDRNRAQLQTAKDEFFKLSNDFEQNTPGKKSNTADWSPIKNLLSQYVGPVQIGTNDVYTTVIKKPYPPFLFTPPSGLKSPIDQPPELPTV